MNKFTSKVAAAALTMALASVSGQALAADSTKPIVIPTHNWSSQVVMAYVIGGISKAWVITLNMFLLILRVFMNPFVMVT